LRRIYKEGKKRLKKELDIVRIAKDLRNVKLMLRKKGYNGWKKFRIKNSKPNVIELSDDDMLQEMSLFEDNEYR